MGSKEEICGCRTVNPINAAPALYKSRFQSFHKKKKRHRYVVHPSRTYLVDSALSPRHQNCVVASFSSLVQRMLLCKCTTMLHFFKCQFLTVPSLKCRVVPTSRFLISSAILSHLDAHITTVSRGFHSSAITRHSRFTCTTGPSYTCLAQTT